MNARNVVFLVVLAVVVIVPDTVRAQRRGGRNELTETLQGGVTVKGVRPGVMQVTTAEGQDWLVTIPTQIENVLRGQAQGQQMTITAAKPLAPPEKASKIRRRGARDRKNDGEQAKDG